MLQIASEFVQYKLYQHIKFLSSQFYLIFSLSLTSETPLKASNFIKIINQSNWNINVEIVGCQHHVSCMYASVMFYLEILRVNNKTKVLTSLKSSSPSLGFADIFPVETSDRWKCLCSQANELLPAVNLRTLRLRGRCLDSPYGNQR